MHTYIFLRSYWVSDKLKKEQNKITAPCVSHFIYNMKCRAGQGHTHHLQKYLATTSKKALQRFSELSFVQIKLLIWTLHCIKN